LIKILFNIIPPLRLGLLSSVFLSALPTKTAQSVTVVYLEFSIIF